MSHCVIRKDLQEYCIPAGDSYVEYLDSEQRFEYRWINEDQIDEQFQIMTEYGWQDAHSIDFDFIDN